MPDALPPARGAPPGWGRSWPRRSGMPSPVPGVVPGARSARGVWGYPGASGGEGGAEAGPLCQLVPAGLWGYREGTAVRGEGREDSIVSLLPSRPTAAGRGQGAEGPMPAPGPHRSQVRPEPAGHGRPPAATGEAEPCSCRHRGPGFLCSFHQHGVSVSVPGVVHTLVRHLLDGRRSRVLCGGEGCRAGRCSLQGGSPPRRALDSRGNLRKNTSARTPCGRMALGGGGGGGAEAPGVRDVRVSGLESRLKRFWPRILTRLPSEVPRSHFPDEETEVHVNLPLSQVGKCLPSPGAGPTAPPQGAPDLRRLHRIVCREQKTPPPRSLGNACHF